MLSGRRGRRHRGRWLDGLAKRLMLDGDQWHDARLLDVTFSVANRNTSTGGEVRLAVEVYGDGETARTRTPLELVCGGVQEIVSTINCVELIDAGDDHIVFARLNETSDVLDLSVCLVGGYIRIVASRYAVLAKGKSPMQ